LLCAIGFKGGQELAHSSLNMKIFWSVVFEIAISIIIPFYTFFILKKKLGTDNAGAITVAYGSISAVIFVTAISFLELQKTTFNGHMVAIMALMEAPAIIIGVVLISFFKKKIAI